MRKAIFLFLLVFFVAAVADAVGQGMKLGEVLIVSTSPLKENVKPDAFKAFINESVASKVTKTNPAVSLHVFQADRGNRKGELLLAFGAEKVKDREAFAVGSPFRDEVISGAKNKPSEYLANTHKYTEYRLIGADKFKTRPTVDILGIHYIKVKKEKAADFEKFVVEKLHPAVGNVLPDMHLMYYKAEAGDHVGTYITVYAITSVEARHKYWPAGAPETQPLKEAFKPHQSLAKELSAYLVEGTYLEPAGGAAAYYESKEWTDFIYQSPAK